MSDAAASHQDMIDAVYSARGDAAVYTDRDSNASNVTVIVDHNLSQYGEAANITAKSVQLCVRTAEVAQVPLREETFTLTVGGKVYTVDSLLDSDEFEYRLLAA